MPSWNILTEAQNFSVLVSGCFIIGLGVAVALACISTPKRTVHWRWVKLISASCGTLAVFLVLLSYDQFIRTTIEGLPSEEKRILPIKFQFALTQLTTQACLQNRVSQNCAEMQKTASE